MSRRYNVTERGSAPAEFVLVAGLLVALSLGVIQLSLITHVRQVLTASAWEGARHASYSNTTLADGRALTRRLIIEGLGPSYVEQVSVRTVAASGPARRRSVSRGSLSSHWSVEPWRNVASESRGAV